MFFLASDVRYERNRDGKNAIDIDGKWRYFNVLNEINV